MSLFRADYHCCCWLRIYTAEDSLFKKCGRIPQITHIFFQHMINTVRCLVEVFLDKWTNTGYVFGFHPSSDLLRRVKEFQKVIANCYIPV